MSNKSAITTVEEDWDMYNPMNLETNVRKKQVKYVNSYIKTLNYKEKEKDYIKKTLLKFVKNSEINTKTAEIFLQHQMILEQNTQQTLKKKVRYMKKFLKFVGVPYTFELYNYDKIKHIGSRKSMLAQQYYNELVVYGRMKKKAQYIKDAILISLMHFLKLDTKTLSKLSIDNLCLSNESASKYYINIPDGKGNYQREQINMLYYEELTSLCEEVIEFSQPKLEGVIWWIDIDKFEKLPEEFKSKYSLFNWTKPNGITMRITKSLYKLNGEQDKIPIKAFYGYKEKIKPIDDRDFLKKPDVKFYDLEKFKCIIPTFTIKELKKLEKDHPGFKDQYNKFKETKEKQFPNRFKKPRSSKKCADIGCKVNDKDTIETSSKQQNEDKIEEDKEEVVYSEEIVVQEKSALKTTVKEGAIERIQVGPKERAVAKETANAVATEKVTRKPAILEADIVEAAKAEEEPIQIDLVKATSLSTEAIKANKSSDNSDDSEDSQTIRGYLKKFTKSNDLQNWYFDSDMRSNEEIKIDSSNHSKISMNNMKKDMYNQKKRKLTMQCNKKKDEEDK
jgi:hypothetical protein